MSWVAPVFRDTIVYRNQQYFSPISIVIFFFLVFIFKHTSLWPYRVGSTILICWRRNNACLRLCFVAKCHHKHAHGLRKFPLPLIYVYIMLMHTLIETLCGYAFAILIFTCLEHKMFSSCVLVLTPLFYNLWLSQHFCLSKGSNGIQKLPQFLCSFFFCVWNCLL